MGGKVAHFLAIRNDDLRTLSLVLEIYVLNMPFLTLVHARSLSHCIGHYFFDQVYLLVVD